MKASDKHTNKRWNNWLVYAINDKWMDKNSHLFKGKLVDLGCGEAPYKDFFLQFADSYTGVDWSNTFHNSKADVVSDLNTKVELETETADTVVSFSAMEHLCEPQAFLNEAYRILKRDGTIVLQVPWQWCVHEAPYDYFRYSPYGLKYLFEKAGFNDVKVQAQSGFFTMLILKTNYFSSRLINNKLFKAIKLNKLFKLLLIPFWALGQLLAPYLDKLDRNWNLETSGYYVIARKI